MIGRVSGFVIVALFCALGWALVVFLTSVVGFTLLGLLGSTPEVSDFQALTWLSVSSVTTFVVSFLFISLDESVRDTNSVEGLKLLMVVEKVHQDHENSSPCLNAVLGMLGEDGVKRALRSKALNLRGLSRKSARIYRRVQDSGDPEFDQAEKEFVAAKADFWQCVGVCRKVVPSAHMPDFSSWKEALKF